MEDYRLPVICLLTLLSVCSAQYDVQVVGQSEPLVVTAGDDVILPCSLRTTIRTVSAVDESVEWQRPDLQPKEVHFYRSREDYNDDQNNNYRGRTSLFKEELKNGNISLKLSKVQVSDTGNYTCFIPKSRGPFPNITVELIVGAASKPQVTVDAVDMAAVILKCEAGGLIYKPEMTWLNSDGNILPGGPTETGTDSDGRYTVRGYGTVQKTDNNTFTCRVLQQKINHKMETEIHVPDRMFPKSFTAPCQSWWNDWWFVGLIGGLTVLIVVVHCILTRIGLLHWGRGVLIQDPQTNGTSQQSGNPLLNGKPHNMALINGVDVA